MNISFIPMPAVSDQNGAILPHETRPLKEVWKAYTHFRDGDVIFAKITPCMENGKIAVARNLHNGMACGSTEFHVLRTCGAILPDYLWRFLRQKSFREEAEHHMTGAVGQRRVPTDYLKGTAIPLAPLNEQKRIVAKLNSLFARTRKAREELARIPILIEHYKQAVLAAAFRGDLTAAWREQNPKSSITEVISEVPPPQQPRGGRKATDSLIPGVSGLSVNNPSTSLPQGWAWIPLLRVARQETGHTPSREESNYWNGDIPWIGIKDAADHHASVINDTYQHVTQEGLKNSSARLLPRDTVCLSRTASVGYVVIMGRDMATSQDFATWTCTSALDPKYLMYAILSEGEEIGRFGKGSTHTTIYFPEIRALHIALAPLDEQQEIVRRIETIFARLNKLSEESDRAIRLIEPLETRALSKAFSGKLVPQDLNDEPSNVLLERIRSERASESHSRSRQRQKRSEQCLLL